MRLNFILLCELSHSQLCITISIRHIGRPEDEKSLDVPVLSLDKM